VRRGLPTVVVLMLMAAGLGILAWTMGKRRVPVSAAQILPTSLPSDPAKLIVITANVRLSDPKDGINAWPNRRELLVKTLLKYNPDVIGCQEVTPAQGAYLIKELATWYTHYPRAGVGTIEGASKSRTAQLIGDVTETFAALDTLFYRTDRFDQVDGMAGLVVPEEPQATPSENTFFSLAVLKEKVGGKITIVVDTHLRYQTAFLMKCAARLREDIALALKKYPGAGVVLMGDMNHNRTSQVYKELEGTPEDADGVGVLSDSFDYTQKPANEPWGNWHEFKGVSSQIWPTDLIFTNSIFTSEGAALIRDGGEKGIWPSDHFFVRVELDRK
jgi:endonuclease/exonuclease/phosphatase family metal-dependent hydrolase